MLNFSYMPSEDWALACVVKICRLYVAGKTIILTHTRNVSVSQRT